MTNDLLKNVFRELRRRKARTVLHIISYALAICVMLTLMSLIDLSKRSSSEILTSTGTHFIVFSVDTQCCTGPEQPDSTEGFKAMGVGSVLLTPDYLEDIQRLPTVKDASPFLMYRLKSDNGKHLFTIGGFDPSRPVSIGSTSCSPSDIVTGRFLTASDALGAMLESDFARAVKLKPGGTITIRGITLKILGIVAPGVRPAKADVYMNIGDAWAIINNQPSHQQGLPQDMNMILVEVKSSAVQDLAIKQVKQLDPDLSVSSYACYRPAAKVMGANEKIMWLIVLAIAAGLVAFSAQSHFSAVMERTRDIGILRAIGWSGKDVVAQIMAESITQSVIGGVAGCALAIPIIFFFPAQLLAGLTTKASMSVSPLTVFALLALSIAAGIAAGIFPVVHLSRQDPAKTLRRI